MPVTPAEYKPTVDELASIMRARTTNELGAELGTFTDATSPTEEQAEQHLTEALSLVSPRLGGSVPARLKDLARSVVNLRAAMIVETSYVPNDDDESGAYDRYEKQYDEALEAYDMAAGHDAGQERRKTGSLKVGTPLTRASEAAS